MSILDALDIFYEHKNNWLGIKRNPGDIGHYLVIIQPGHSETSYQFWITSCWPTTFQSYISACSSIKSHISGWKSLD